MTAASPALPSSPLRVLAIAGSLRAGSYNRALLRAARDLATEGLEIVLYDIAPIPFFNQDVEQEGDPEPVARFKDAIRAADALLVATPEYNHGVPGVLKNALDWASRPHRRSSLDCKCAAVLGATAGRGSTFQAQGQLREMFVYTGTCTLAQPEFSLSRAGEAFDESGRLASAENREALGEFLDALIEWVRVIQSGERFQAHHARLTADPVQLPLAS